MSAGGRGGPKIEPNCAYTGVVNAVTPTSNVAITGNRAINQRLSVPLASRRFGPVKT
jgi:hypothetical protein